jgi:uncharacterized protein YbjT (DUF2867 family)
MKALIIGATGATGKDLVQVLLQDPDYRQVTIFVRRSTGNVHPKLVEILTDFDNIEKVSELIKGDVWFSCLGTTLKAAGSKKSQWHIDYDIPSTFAEIAKRNDVAKAVLLSAYGASTSSKIFYSRLKGSLEEKISYLSFDQCIIFRPGLLLRRNTDRAGERISGAVIKFMNSLGLIRKFRAMPTLILAQKMAKAPKVLSPGIHYVELNKIFSL